MEDKTVARDTIVEAVQMTKQVLAERAERGTMLNTRDDAFRLFYWAMMELSDMGEGTRTGLLRQLLENTEQPL